MGRDRSAGFGILALPVMIFRQSFNKVNQKIAAQILPLKEIQLIARGSLAPSVHVGRQSFSMLS